MSRDKRGRHAWVPAIDLGAEPGEQGVQRFGTVQVATLAKQGPEATGESVEVECLDQGYTGERAAEDAEAICLAGALQAISPRLRAPAQDARGSIC